MDGISELKYNGRVIIVNIQRFNRDRARSAHDGTMLLEDIELEGVDAPFKATWGFLEENSEMKGNPHPDEEVYVIIKGSGVVFVGEEDRTVEGGDLVVIPSNEHHSLCSGKDGPLLWAALRWD